MELALHAVHAFAWCVYVGGSVCMELVLRHAQGYMRPSQVAVVCERAGQLYRWWSLVALTLLGVTGVALVLVIGETIADMYASLLIAAIVLWVLQMVIWMRLTFGVHPAMHARLQPSMSEQEIALERSRVGAAIRRMDRYLRTELGLAVVALCVGASLHVASI
jgi:uncharacterized membrane protein